MFYVYDIDGLKFKGPLEQLEKWRSVARKEHIQPLKEKSSSPPFPEGRGAQAVAAYQKIISRDNMVEPLVHIHQIMSSPVATIHHEMPLTEAWWMMQKKTIRQLVVTSDVKKVVGMLSDRDILERINVIDNKIQVADELVVNEVIKPDIMTTDSMSDIRRVAKVQAYYHIDALPVLEKERLVGIVTRGDILRGFAENPKLNLWA